MRRTEDLTQRPRGNLTIESIVPWVSWWALSRVYHSLMISSDIDPHRARYLHKSYAFVNTGFAKGFSLADVKAPLAREG